MANKKLTEWFALNPTTVQPGDLLYSVGPSGAPVSGGFQAGQIMQNRYRIVVTVVSNDLVVSIKHLDGTTDPSTSEPLFFKIGNNIRSVTSALSITIPDGTNWFNCGSSELATYAVPFFVYVLYDSNSSAVALTISRKPYFKLVSSASATTTNENHIYGYSGFTTTDEMENIGYFEATLSAGAAYTWSVATFTNANLRSVQTMESRIMSYLPTITVITTTSGTAYGSYVIQNRSAKTHVSFIFGASSTMGTGAPTFTTPFTYYAFSPSGTAVRASGLVLDSGSTRYDVFAELVSSGTSLTAWLLDSSGTYVVRNTFSATAPMTWATNDVLSMYVDSLIT